MINLFNNLEECLKKNNIKPSYHRIKIMEYLVTKNNHPTADEIYNELVKEIPTLSKTTVYNTLNLLIKAKLVRLITIEDYEMRYDANILNHGHFKCEVCGKIFDFSINIDSAEIAGLSKFIINEKHVYIKGICPSCIKNKNKNSGG